MSDTVFDVRLEPCSAPAAALIVVVGEVDALTTPRMQQTVGEQLTGPSRHVILDLTGVSFLSAAGLTVLVEAARMAVDQDVHVCLVAAHRAVLRPMQLTALTGLMPIHSSREHALLSVHEPGGIAADAVSGDGVAGDGAANDGAANDGAAGDGAGPSPISRRFVTRRAAVDTGRG
jgi:anti-sigma B factor antagonist